MSTVDSVVRPFHLAIPVDDLVRAREFYGTVLGCAEGRSAEQWIDWNFFGHQLVTHVAPKPAEQPHHNPVDGHAVPVPHFGVVLTMSDWQQLAERVRAHDIAFVIEPYVRFAGEPGEQATMFFYDFSGNALEFKAFNDLAQLFAT
ncbi:glyoxalase [Pseudidiomarina sediminum]|uniref:Glyoxalase n=1 Tax=Pseudidiomarina sediminum TaxID=431675 RepID=A0A432ZA96_9GAMM|nr:VOC family protein [Pseudidiomarina sediminum]MBY6064063.1 VOC family protein [Pseudidiomarina sediminum]RUO74858.1 glyoxalase [Pseudidiomarina sediminum]